VFESVVAAVTPNVPPTDTLDAKDTTPFSVGTVADVALTDDADKAPVVVPAKVVAPETLSVFESTVAPVTFSVLDTLVAPDKVAIPETPRVLQSVAAFDTNSVLLKVAAPVTLNAPLTSVRPATYKFRPKDASTPTVKFDDTSKLDVVKLEY
jgi:hypothetical protein